jgi:hypothetical protein
LVGPTKSISSQRPALICVLLSVEAEDFGQFLKQARQPALLQQVQQKAQAFLDDHPQQPTDPPLSD